MVDKSRLRFRAGERLSARKLNTLAAQAYRNNPASVSAFTGYAAFPVLRLEVKALDNAQRRLECTLPGQTGEPSAQTWFVYLPEIFTEPSRGATNYTYTALNTRDADDGNDQESQEITPPFVLNEIIYAFWIEGAGDVLFLGDGRMWARVRQ